MRIRLPVRWEGNAGRAPGLEYDCELASRVKEGDRHALGQLLERHISRVHTYLLHRLGEGHEETIRKVLAATFAQGMRGLGPYSNGTAPTPMDLWLIRLAERNLARVPISTPRLPTPSSDLDRLRAAMLSLPNRHRFVLSLALFEQMPAGDIAHALGTAPSRAMRRLRVALKRVGKALDKQQEAS